MIYDEDLVRKVCSELGIELVEGRGYSMVNGVEIDPNDIDTLFDFPVYDLSDIDIDDTRLSYEWSAPTNNSDVDIQNEQVLHAVTTIGTLGDEFEILKEDFKYEYFDNKDDAYSESSSFVSELYAA